MTSTERRLLVICHGFPPYYGGGEHVAYYLARAAARSGRWHVTVLTSDIGGRLPARETMEGMDIVRIPARKKEWSNHTVFELLTFLFAARGFDPVAACGGRPDLVLAHFTIPAGWVARRLRRRFGTPYGVVLHGSDVPGHRPGRFGWIYPLITPFVRRVWRGAAAVLSVSRPLKELAARVCPGLAVEVIPNGVDTAVFQSLEKAQRDVSRDWNLVMVARFEDVKGHRVLFEALQPWSTDAGWTLHLCGSGPDETRTRERARAMGLEERVVFHGLLGRDEVRALLQRADAFVLPSFKEGLPLSLLEAMACGLPVITTPVGEIPDVVRDGDNGLLVPAGEAAPLHAALERVRSDTELAARLGAAAAATARGLDWTLLWERYEAVLDGGMHARRVA